MIVQRHLTFFAFLTGILLVLGAAASFVVRSDNVGESFEFRATSPTLTLAPEALAAHSAIVYDPAKRHILFAKNAFESLPLASITKLMAAEALLNEAPLSTYVTITPEALRPAGDWGLRPGELWSLHDLLLYSLVASSNDAMAAAVGVLGDDAVNTMNRSALRLGLTQTYFLNPTGLDLDVEMAVAGGYGSARDVAMLAAAFLRNHPDYFEATTRPTISFNRGDHIIEETSTAAPLATLPGFIGAKTGYTDLAGGNLVAAFDASVGKPLIAVVLGSTREGRFTDMEQLISAARAAFRNQP